MRYVPVAYYLFLPLETKLQHVLMDERVKPQDSPEDLYLKYTLLFELTMFLYWYSVDIHWRRQWHPTPVLLPGESH